MRRWEFPALYHSSWQRQPRQKRAAFLFQESRRKSIETPRQVLVLWGDAERNWLGEIKETFKDIPKVRVLEESLTLADLAAVLTQACGYLGNDSGVTQLASRLRARTFAVFQQHTDPKLWGPQESIILAAKEPGTSKAKKNFHHKRLKSARPRARPFQEINVGRVHQENQN